MGMAGMNMGLAGMGQQRQGIAGPSGLTGGGHKQLGAGNSAMQASKMGSGIVDEGSKQW